MKVLALSGFVPEQICDTVRFTGYSGGQKISHYCGYVSDYISQVLNDSSVDGAVYPRSCDSSRVIGSYLQDSGKFLYQITVPVRRDDAAVQFLALNIMEYKKEVERHYGIEIKDVEERAEMINARNEKLRRLYEEIGELSYGSYLKMLHEMLQKPLCEQAVPLALPKKPTSGKKVYLVGSFLSNWEIAASIENAGMAVAGDNLTESKRLFSAPVVKKAGSIYENIAGSMLGNRLSPSQDDFMEILSGDIEEIRRKGIKGLVYVTQKYCEPYDYMFFIYKRMLDENGIPALKLSLADSTDGRRMDAALEAFADIL